MVRYTIARGDIAIITIGRRCFARNMEQLICFAATNYGMRAWAVGQATHPEPDLRRK